ncbi:MAG: DUF5372 family protein, partial [Phototrophicaceae bacterium]
NRRSSHQVTVTHPFHPLRGQQVTVLCIYQRSNEPDLYIETATGMTMCLAMSLTDYELQVSAQPVVHLLTGDGLLQIANFIKQKKTK